MFMNRVTYRTNKLDKGVGQQRKLITWSHRVITYGLLLQILVLLSACTPMVHSPGTVYESPTLSANYFLTSDGVKLPLRSWLPEDGNTRAAIVALHGMNDYSNFFDAPGRYFSKTGIACYAYDQRGFGLAPNRGLWAGTNAYADDLTQITHLIKEQHPGIPVYLLGESMGGATVIVSVTADNPSPADGIILAAPAVWGRETMPWYQRMVLWLSSHTVPWMKVTGSSLGVKPSDNIEMLRALSRDPLVIKGTRIETIHGLVDLMDAALFQSPKISVPTLLLYGERDEIVPKLPTYQMLKNMPPSHPWRAAFYENGYHMLLRDLQAETLWNDIATWIDSQDQALPSGADLRAQSILANNTL